MSYTDKNRIFFGLFHYILSEQSNVNWALKTSLVNFTGLNETISQRQYKNDSISNDIIKFVKDVKPYHVQFDNYIEKYSSKDDICNVIPSDSMFQTIKVRYDAVSIKPDIKDTVYTYTYSGEPTQIKSTNESIKYLNIELKSIFIRKKDFRGDWYWELYSSVQDGDLIFVEKENYVKKFSYILNKDGSWYYDLINLTNKELVEFENTTAANRLFLYKTHDFDLIRDYLNAHFKGLTIDGGDFNIDRFGYDAFLYDLKRYEEPVKTSAYCIVNTNYTQISVGENTFKIDIEETLTKNNLKITSSIDGEIEDYFLNDDIKEITLFYETRINEEITIIYKEGTSEEITYNYITNTFTKSDDESYTRSFINNETIIYKDKNDNVYDCYKVKIPYTPIKAGKIVVEIERPSGYRYISPIFFNEKDYIYVPKEAFRIENNVKADDLLNWKIFISIADYSLIYDKIYTWEDIYGIANNKVAWDNYFKNAGLIQNNYGGKFLNPYYEQDRPSELSVIYPQNSLIIYTSRANAVKDNDKSPISFAAKKLFYFDFKNKQTNFNVIKTTKLKEPFKLGDKVIKIEKDIFEKPYKSQYDDKLIPGKIFIKSELIEFYDYEYDDEGSIILKNIRRGCNGTFLNDNIYEEGTIVYPQYNETTYDYDLTPSYYYINSNDISKLEVNGNVPLNELLKVYKTTNIELLTDINENTTSFNISSNTVNLPIYNNNELIKNGFFYIGGDKIEFKNIEKNNNAYTISNFILPIGKSYKAGTSIQSIKYDEIKSSNYKIERELGNKTTDDETIVDKTYISFPYTFNKGECVIIENHNKNVFQ